MDNDQKQLTGIFNDILMNLIVTELKNETSSKFADTEYMMSKINNYESFLQVKIDTNIDENDSDFELLQE